VDLRPWLEDPHSAGVFLDFDGTLAPIVDDFDQAEAYPGTARRLARMASRFALVAVVSGRPVAYLLSRLAGAGATELVGLYGMERTEAGTGTINVSAAALSWRPALAAAAEEAEAAAPRGVVVERKGLATTLHYRHAPDQAGWADEFAAGQVGRRGLAAHPGKMSVELRPPVATDKGTVVAELAAGLGAVCFVGDDVGDLPAFSELARLRTAGVATLAVAVEAGETPRQLVAAADLTVDGPAGVAILLDTRMGGR
jgi:trehalose 6-phosphate phosphatase